MKAHQVSLPYVDNAKAITITLAINIGVLFLFFWPDGVTFQGAITDSLISALVTTAINMSVVFASLKKMRSGGLMPARVPISRFMQMLPKNPLILGLICAVLFGALITGITGFILWFFNLRDMAFIPWSMYKLIYTTLLSAKITEFCIFRYVQPDWANIGTAETQTAPSTKTIKNPLPRISVFKEIFGSVTTNIALNIIIGTAFGGVVVGAGYEVVIHPTTIQGIPVTGLIFGFITGLLVTNGVTKAMREAIFSSGQEMLKAAAPDKRLMWMPKRKTALTCLVCGCVMIFSSVALWAVMTLFGILIMNFYQFTVFITIYAAVISRPLSFVLVRRCAQPDYIGYLLKIKTADKGSDL